MYYSLHRICGHPEEQTVVFRLCTPEEVQIVFDLQNEVHALMPHPEWFVASTLDDIEQDFCIGAWQGEHLGAYFTMKFYGKDAHNYAAFMEIPEIEWSHWANADSVIVHPDWRGNGLQRALLTAALRYLPSHIKGIGATIDPENEYSLKNALALGFTVVCRKEMYGGYDRYLLAKKL